MNEIQLERSEFLVLLDAVRATAVVGIGRESLFPRNEEEHKKVLRQGIALLEQRGLIKLGHGLHPDLVRLTKAVAYPQVAIFTIRHVQTSGSQLFLFYLSREGIVEQTFPADGVHRLAVLPSPALLVPRIVQLLSLPEQLSSNVSLEIAQEKFFQCNNLAQQHQRVPALAILQETGIPFVDADALVTAMQEPDFRGEVTLLKCEGQTIVDARDIVVIRGRETVWYAMQIVPGEPILRVASVRTQIMQSLLSQCLVKLIQTSV